MVLVSHPNKLIYIKTPKSAGTSVEKFLEPLCLPGGKRTTNSSEVEISNVGIVGARLTDAENKVLPPDENTPHGWYNHMPLWKVKDNLGENVFHKYKKIANIRNPYDLVLSNFIYTEVRQSVSPTTDIELLREQFNVFAESHLNHSIFRDMLAYEGKIQFDYLIRFENLKQDVANLIGALGVDLDLSKFPHKKNVVELRQGFSVADFYSGSSLAHSVREKFDWLFELGGYSDDIYATDRIRQTNVLTQTTKPKKNAPRKNTKASDSEATPSNVQMKGPKWVFCCGMPRSGSTVQFLLTREILESQDKAVFGGFVASKADFDEIAKKFQNEEKMVIVKSHNFIPSYRELFAAGQATGIYIYRDMRDAVLSVFNKLNTSFDPKRAVRATTRNLEFYNNWNSVGPLYVSRYEDIILDLATEAKNIASHLSTPISEEYATELADKYGIESQKARIKEFDYGNEGTETKSGQNLNPETQLHSNHIHSGASGQWQDSLDEDQIAVIEGVAGGWLQAHNYKLHIEGDGETYFTYKIWPECGFTDQIDRLSLIYQLGGSLNYKYVHTPFRLPRSSENIGQYVGLDGYFQTSISDYDDDDFVTLDVNLYREFSNEPISSLAFLQALVRKKVLAARAETDKKILVRFELQRNEQVKQRGPSESDSKVVWRKTPAPALTKWLEKNSAPKIDFNSIYNDARKKAPRKSCFKRKGLKILVHLRQGDLAILKTPWNTYVPVGKQQRFKELAKAEQAGDTYIQPETYLNFLEDLSGELDGIEHEFVIFSDGYDRAFEKLRDNRSCMSMSDEKFNAILETRDIQNRENFRGFEALENATCIIGEDDEKLFDLIHAAKEADIIICGTQQKFIPQFLEYYWNPDKPQVVVQIHKNAKYSRGWTYPGARPLRPEKAIFVPAKVPEYQISEVFKNINLGLDQNFSSPIAASNNGSVIATFGSFDPRPVAQALHLLDSEFDAPNVEYSPQPMKVIQRNEVVIYIIQDPIHVLIDLFAKNQLTSGVISNHGVIVGEGKIDPNLNKMTFEEFAATRASDPFGFFDHFKRWRSAAKGNPVLFIQYKALNRYREEIGHFLGVDSIEQIDLEKEDLTAMHLLPVESRDHIKIAYKRLKRKIKQLPPAFTVDKNGGIVALREVQNKVVFHEPPAGAGMFSILNQLVNTLKNYEDTSETVGVADNYFLYGNWGDFFSSPSVVSPTDDDATKARAGGRDLTRPWRSVSKDELIGYEGPSHKLATGGILYPPENPKAANLLIKKHIKLTPELQASIDGEIEESGIKKMLALHIRGAGRDHGGVPFMLWKMTGDSTRVPYEIYFTKADAWLEKHDTETLKHRIFVFSDSMEVIETVRSYYGDRVSFRKESTISTEGEMHLDQAIPDRGKLGRDIITEAWMMSQSKYLIHGNSNVSNFIECLNLELRHEDIFEQFYDPSRPKVEKTKFRAKSNKNVAKKSKKRNHNKKQIAHSVAKQKKPENVVTRLKAMIPPPVKGILRRFYRRLKKL